MVKAPESPRPSKTRLYFIENEQRSGFSTFFFHRADPVAGRDNNSCFTLYSFDDHTGSLFSDRVYRVRRVVVKMKDAWQKRSKRISPVFASHYTQCPLGRSMIRIVESNDF